MSIIPTYSPRLHHWVLYSIVSIVSIVPLASYAAPTDAQWFDLALTETRIHDFSRLGVCSASASYASKACHFEIRNDYWITRGHCVNLADEDERRECKQEKLTELLENIDGCAEQFAARRDLCELLGESAYDPSIDPADFVDPLSIGSTTAANPYLPLVPGTTRIYEGDGETITVTVTEDTKEILGVICIVVHDVVTDENGEFIEDTFDWLAQDAAGNVWYFGEISRNFDNGELVDLAGSWEAGVEGAKPGILMEAMPQVGNLYRQEFALGEAEDMAEVLSLNASASVPAASCDASCLLTSDFTPLEPSVEEEKFYAPGIGLILEVDLENGERVELVDLQSNR